MVHLASIVRTVPHDNINTSSLERVVNLIVADYTHLPSSQFPAHQVSMVECPKALGVTRQLSIPHHFGGLEQIQSMARDVSTDLSG